MAGRIPRDEALEKKIMAWMAKITEEEASGKFENYIADGTALSKVMIKVCFNSVPTEEVDSGKEGNNPAVSRINTLIREMYRYGVRGDLFKPDDMMGKRNTGKIASNIKEFADLVAKDPKNKYDPL